MKNSKKKSNKPEIESRNQTLRDMVRKAFKSSGISVVPMEELPEHTDRYEVTFWGKKPKQVPKTMSIEELRKEILSLNPKAPDYLQKKLELAREVEGILIRERLRGLRELENQKEE